MNRTHDILELCLKRKNRSVVPVRSDFWPKEPNGLHKWAVVTKANISLCTCSADCALCTALWDVCTPRAEVVSQKLMTVSHFGYAQRGNDSVSDLSGFENKYPKANDMLGGGVLSSWKSLGFEEEKKGSDVWGGGGLSREPDLLEARSVTSPDLKLLGNWDEKWMLTNKFAEKYTARTSSINAEP